MNAIKHASDIVFQTEKMEMSFQDTISIACGMYKDNLIMATKVCIFRQVKVAIDFINAVVHVLFA